MPKKVETSLVLRVCRPGFSSYGGFIWPSEIGAAVSAPDWQENKERGNGLHGWLYGQGDHNCVDFWSDPDAKWLVLEVPTASIIMLGGKCKFPSATVRFAGSKADAAAYLIANEPKAAGVAVIGATLQAPDQATAAVGALGTATAGDDGTATAGDDGTATAGNYGTATAGNYGTATAGNYGTATAGEKGEIRIRYWDSGTERYRTAIGYVGEDGIKADTKYRLNDQHKFKEVAK